MIRDFQAELITDARIVAEQIRDSLGADRVLLFGSGSRGDSRQSSDLDLIVVSPSELGFKERQKRLYQAVDAPRDADLLWYTPEEVQSMLDRGNSFLKHALSTAVEI